MRNAWITIAMLGLLMFLAPSGFAQTPGDPSPLPARALSIPPSPAPDLLESDPAARLDELQRWMQDFGEWHAWSERWRGRREPGWFTGYRGRREKPTPPAWLPSRCEAAFEEAEPLITACALLAAWREPDTPAQNLQRRITAVAGQEREPNTAWWEHIHLDLFWPAVQWQNNIYGVVGMHVATQVAGRFQVFTAPGVILLNLPARNGTRVWKVAGNYGIGYRLFDFRFPGGRPAELHVNLAKTYIFADTTDVVAGKTTDFIGFSVTFKKDR
jgi:hypothetical protein